MGTVHKFNDIALEDINFSKPEKVGTSYFGSISYQSNEKPLYIQTPRLRSLSDLTSVNEKKNPYIELDIDAKNIPLFDFFMNIDDKCINNTFNQSSSWFNKELPLEAIDDMYQKITKPFKKDTNPKIKFKLPVIKNEIQCSVYNQERVFLNISDIKEDSDIQLIIHFRGLKFLKQYFYIDCYVSQIKVFQEDPKYNIIKEYSMIDDEDEKINIFDEEIKQSLEEDQLVSNDEDKLRENQEEEKLKKEEEDRLRKEKEEEEKLKKEKEEEERLRKEKEEEEEKERLRKEKEAEEEKKRIQEEIEAKKKEMEELMAKLK